MNGGFASRPLVGLAPDGGIGARLNRDIRRLGRASSRSPGERPIRRLSENRRPRAALAEAVGRRRATEALGPRSILCRDLSASTARSSKTDGYRRPPRGKQGGADRKPKEANGVTGDPFAPIDLRDSKKGRKPLTVTAEGFDYKLVSQIISRDKFEPAPLQVWRQDDGASRLSIVFSALARGQGETNGLHERRVPIPAGQRLAVRQGGRSLRQARKERVDDAGNVRGSVLRLALFDYFRTLPKL